MMPPNLEQLDDEDPFEDEEEVMQVAGAVGDYLPSPPDGLPASVNSPLYSGQDPPPKTVAANSLSASFGYGCA
jgi:hypothetical protein